MQLCFAGILRSRGGFLERAARLGEEEDATVTTNTRIIDFNIDHLNTDDEGRIEVIASGLFHFREGNSSRTGDAAALFRD